MLPIATPALPLHEAGKYVAGAYVVFVVLLVVYVGIMAAKLRRIERDLREVAEAAERGGEPEAAPGPGAEAAPMSESLASPGGGGGAA